jgi:hypothetical protein
MLLFSIGVKKLNKMKNIKISFRNIILAAILPLVVISGCTKNFEKYNTNTNGITDAQLSIDFNSLGAFYPSIQNAWASDGTIIDKGELQSPGSFSGYFNTANAGAVRVCNYFLPQVEPYGVYNLGFNSVMSPVNEVRRRGARTTAPDFWAVALILKVASMQKITDIYGPIPYSQYGNGAATVPYDSQPVIYNRFFAELDTATTNLKAYIAANPTAKPFLKFDKLYGGNYTGWLKFANSLRLRLALQIVKADPAKAKLQAEKAMDPASGGVITANSENAMGGLDAIWVGTHSFQDVRGGAAVICYMNGYKDPRIGKYFDVSTIVPGKYIGIRAGSDVTAKNDYVKFSDISTANFTQTTLHQWITASEVYFLRAEGALRGWSNMGGTAQQLYETGISTSFTQWGVSGADTYIGDASSVATGFVDPQNPANSAAALPSVTIKWDNAASNEVKLERIITQKWLATFPDCTTAWSTFRRTGYPKLFTVAVNSSGGTISTEIQIRRMSYPQAEAASNTAEVAKAVTLMGGPDNGGTRLWWDTTSPNF